jgi:uncharacterized protein YbaP (TraB family)
MPRIFCTPLICLLLLAGTATAFDTCHTPTAYHALKTRYVKGLLFRIEKCGQPTSYLFGTLHMDDPDVTKAAAQAFATLPKVQQAGFEIVAAPAELKKQAAAYMSVSPNDPQRLSKLIGIVYFAKLIRLLGSNHISLPALERMQPWAVAMLVELKDIITRGPVLDEQIKKAATDAGKHVFGLETPEEQFDVFAQSPQAYQVIMLKDTMDEYADAKRLRDEMQAAYIAHDGLKIMAIDKEMLTLSGHPTIDAYYNKRLLDDRNAVIERRMEPHLEKTGTLICIGMLHLLGKDGVIALLERDGYRVTSIP